MAATEEAFLQRMAQRQAARRQLPGPKADQTRDASQVATALAEWAERKADLEARLAALEQGQRSPRDEQEAQKHLLDTEQAASGWSFVLPAYDNKLVAGALAAFRQRLAAARAGGQKRFGFARAKRASAAEPALAPAPALAAAAGRGDAVAAEPRGSGDKAEAPGGGPEELHVHVDATTAAASSRVVAGLRDQVVEPPGGEVAGGDWTLRDLRGCRVTLRGCLATLRLLRLQHCQIAVGAVQGPTYAEGLEGCSVSVASHQVRIHTSTTTIFRLRTGSSPIIEHCTALRFGAYEVPGYEGAGADLAGAGLAADGGQWRDVKDFGWLRPTPSPNWSLLDGPRDARQPEALGEEARAPP